MPVFHIGFFKHILVILKIICKRCARVLLPPDDRIAAKKKYKRCIDSLQRNRVFNWVVESAKKNSKCIYCASYNGMVKKMPGQPARIVHLKFK